MGGQNVSTRHGIIVGLIALLSSACASTLTVTEPDRLRAEAAYDRGLSQMNARQMSPALAALREAVAVDPTVARYWDTLGLLYLELGRPDLAIEQMRKAVALDPHLADAHFHLGTAYAEANRWEEAVTSYRKALAEPTLAIPDLVNQNLGLALYHLKRYGEAESVLRFAISLEPKLQAAYYNLGLVLVAENRPDEARVVYQKACELGPDDPFCEAARERLRSLGEGK